MPLHLPPRELSALLLLVDNAGQIVTPRELKQALWGDVHVTAESVPRCLSTLRARLQPADCIQTVYKRGYRLFAEVRPLEAPPTRPVPRLAVPPFATEFGVPEHLGTALAEDMIAHLSNAPVALVSVLARDSVFTLARSGLTAQQIGETLKADLVLAGTLRAFAAHFRLRAEMIRVADGVQIWVEDLLIERSRITGSEFELIGRLNFRLRAEAAGPEAEVSSLPADASTTGLAASPSARLPRGSFEARSIAASAESETGEETSPMHREAFELFLRGRHEWQTMERHRMQDGLQHLTRAAELDPALIAAKVELVHLCVTQAFYGYMSPTVEADLVRRTVESVPEFPLHAEGLLPALAWVNLHFEHNLPGALWALEHSAHLPHDPWVTRARTMFALSRHRFDEAIDLLRAAIHHDPYAPWLQNRLAWAYHLNGNARESMALVEQTLRLSPEHEGSALYGAMILAFHGHFAQAVPMAEERVRRQPYFDIATAVHAYVLACAGRAAEAQAIVERLRWLGRERYVLRSFIPAVLVALGDLDAALIELRAANEQRCPWFFQMLADPRLRPLHGHPEFEQLQAISTLMEAANDQPAL